MTVPSSVPDAADEPAAASTDGPSVPPTADPPPFTPASAREATIATCPYLVSSGGAWRHASPSRDHRCGALEPPAPQPPDKQRRHCLSSAHEECAIFGAARAARAAALLPSGDPAVVAGIDARRRPIARTAPILLEQPGLVEQAVRLPFDRGPGQLALVALMVLAFAVVAIARLSSGGTQEPVPSAAPSVASVATASPSAEVALSPSPSAGGSSSEAPPSVEPSFSSTYTVRKGDTLSGIATRFKTTAAALRALNGLTSSTLHTGQVLKIP
ncbi:MAG TPA: LysM peptidoglycan-binding domain-containing protein [Candidatus Limnocylindrales bacterium]|nr:LysM peptidoglycan-binding domain-containing protein [Candidatus Limnocylindrales bacterium]